MSIIDSLKNTIQDFLPETLHDMWWGVPLIWFAIMLILILLVVKKIMTKKNNNKIQQFKQQNPANLQSKPITVPEDHKKVMETHNVHVPHQEYKQLDNYIEAMLKRRMAPQMIKNYLLNVGWQKEVVDEAMLKITNKQLTNK